MGPTFGATHGSGYQKLRSSEKRSHAPTTGSTLEGEQMPEWAIPGDADLRRLVIRTTKEFVAALGEHPAGVPVWSFPLRAFEIAADLAAQNADPASTPMSVEVCLELLTYTPIRLRSCDGAEVATCLAQWASDTEQTAIDVIRDFEQGHLNDEVRWEQLGDDGIHVLTTIRRDGL
ncbi:hypothetical protein IU479_35235 [Nocardia abscessus]|uniref:hypothetical protein n=1 Tax=Nocardia abscessus TaxID=120957 RepID=UPI00189371CF|nr:hypothetical protein [Nocardia abscessus]MBF6223325.1 hypothetical protein [Nocardia abscessus]